MSEQRLCQWDEGGSFALWQRAQPLHDLFQVSATAKCSSLRCLLTLSAGYIIMLFPSCVIVSHYGPGKWLPTCELMWGILTCCLSLSKNAKTIYGLRFLIGLFEGSAWPGYFTIIR